MFDRGFSQVLNTVTRIVPDRLLEWNVGAAEQGALGHVYGWELTPVSDTETDVTNYTEWSGIPENLQQHWPIVPQHMLEESVEKLRRIATAD